MITVGINSCLCPCSVVIGQNSCGVLGYNCTAITCYSTPTTHNTHTHTRAHIQCDQDGSGQCMCCEEWRPFKMCEPRHPLLRNW